MAFFENLGNKLSDVGKSVSNKASEVVEVNKINSKISEKKKEITSAYEEIGKLIYEKFKSGTLADEDCQAICNNISSFEEELVDLNAKLITAKGSKTCPQCGNVCSSSANFCNSCGNSFN